MKVMVLILLYESTVMYTVFAMSRIIYSLEYLNIGTVNLKKLETTHNRILRNIQCLPIRPAVAAIYILLGTLPIQATIDQRHLSSIPTK